MSVARCALGHRSARARAVGRLATFALTAIAICSACSSTPPAPPAADGSVERHPLRTFVLSDLGGISRATLETNALPYRVVATALILEEERARGISLGRADLPRLFQQYGFLQSPRILNWPAHIPAPELTRPLGMVSRTISGPTPLIRIDAVTLGCASCHAGPTYDAAGTPRPEAAWLGFPNTSLDLEAYTQAVYRGLKIAAANPDAFRARVHRTFPEMGFSERTTLRMVLMRRLKSRMRELERGIDAPLPFSSGGAGRTNGAAALRHRFGLPVARDSSVTSTAFTSIPDLSHRGLRSSLLYDGVYAPASGPRFAALHGDPHPTHVDSLASIVAFFIVPTMGADPTVAERAIPAMRGIVQWLAHDYRPPAFPGPVDAALADEGEAVYASRCASCHGSYERGPPPRKLISFPNRLVPQHEMGTDSSRWAMTDTAFERAFARQTFRRYVSVARTGGYVAPILSGAWATAPYLHNGSVPTMWHLLTPAERPAAFNVGGHRLDFERMGIAGELDAAGVWATPRSYTPWSKPELYDTRRPGMSSAGHEPQVAGLTERHKRALIEYLKQL